VPLRLEDYALVGDTETAGLVGIDGSIDWLCLPRFDAPACFAALLGGPEHGRWLIAPAGGVRRVQRRYRPGTLVLETVWETEDGIVRVVDCMPPRDRIPDVLRLVEGVSGRVPTALLMIPLVGFLESGDARVDGTIRAIERELVEDGFVMRYPTQPDVDGLPPGEGAFLPCSFWLVDCLALTGRRDEAAALYDRLLGLRNDVGLLSEGYDPRAKRLVGNFPQAFTHVGLVNSALNLDPGPPIGPADRRRRA
jgi:GH15 family glucan-1,4-alpha-glucosidase